jgi:hypothetical protein
MAKNTKALSGPAKRKYFRDVLAADTGVTADAAKRLTDRFDRDLSHMRVRQHAALKTAGEQPSPPEVSAAPVPAVAAAAPAAFDPHAFSLIVVMTKQGAEGLRRRLEAIDSVEHLKALARAQHVAVEATLDDAAQLRSAIVAGTAQRIADRRAAAS